MIRVLLLILSLTSSLLAAEPVTAIAYHPAGVAVGQGGRVSFFDSQGKPLTRIEDVPGRITAIAFDAKGTRLAVAAGTVGQSGSLDVFAIANDLTATRLLRLPKAHADAIYGLTFAPNGTLASAGYDRVIHLWKVAAGTKEPTRILKDHSDAIYGIAFHPEGKLLASVAADRTVKVWDHAAGTRLYTLSEATDWLYTVAWSPDGKHLAAGGVDRSVHIWQANATGGTLMKSTFAHERPVSRLAYNTDGRTLVTLGEENVIKRWDTRTMQEAAVFPAQPDSVLALAMRPDGQQIAIGRYDGAAELLDLDGKRIATLPLGEVKTASDAFPTVNEAAAATDSTRKAMPITLPVTVLGAIDRPGDVDYFRFSAKAGDEIGLHVAMIEGAGGFNPVLTLTDDAGRLIAEGTSTLGFHVPKDGAYAVGLRDRDYLGGADRKYRLRVGPLPIVTGVFPLGATRGKSTTLQLRGVNLGKATTAIVTIPADAKAGSNFPVPLPKLEGLIGTPNVVVDAFPGQWIKPDRSATLDTLPGTVDGILLMPAYSNIVRFQAKKGERLAIEVNARRLGSPLDSVIEILDARGQSLPRTVLRATSKTTTTLRDHTAEVPGIRLETWHDFRTDDYLFADGELMRIVELPRGPDDDCDFYQVNGKRQGYLGTTPNFHPYGVTMYRVELHPPGRTFPPNGMPVTTLFWRNDDGGPALGSDSKLLFDPPADGAYQVRVHDSRGQGGADYAYRLTIRPPQPDFAIRFTPTAPEIWKGGSLPIVVTADRFDDHDSPIALEFQGLPAGFTAPIMVIPGNLLTTTITLTAADSAVLPKTPPALKLVGTSMHSGREMTHEAKGMPLAFAKAIPDITTKVLTSEVVLRPGHEARFTVAIERKNTFKGRVPITIAGLPHGVRVRNVGLNGVLITERDTSREVVLYAEPWVQPSDGAFTIFAKRESTKAEYAAPAVRLRVE